MRVTRRCWIMLALPTQVIQLLSIDSEANSKLLQTEKNNIVLILPEITIGWKLPKETVKSTDRLPLP